MSTGAASVGDMGTAVARAGSAVASPRAAADLGAGFILATVEIPASPPRVFHSLSSADVIDWWVRPGVFDTRTWEGEVSRGGRWRTSGVGPRGPYELTGEYVDVDSPRRLTHTWEDPEFPGVSSTVTYDLTPVEDGTRITLRHEGLGVPLVCANTCVGWETSFAHLADMLSDEATASSGTIT